MASIVPLLAVPNQTLAVPLANQNCRLNVYQKGSGLFIDVLVDDEPIILGVICQNANRVVRDLYLGFAGDFAFLDTQGVTDPVYSGLGDRYQLIYIEAGELPEGVG
jgi:hypothetical protein